MELIIDITADQLRTAQIWLFITTLTYFFMNGAQIFETFVIVPRWTAAAPESFGIFRGKYGLDFKAFWIIVHSIHELTFIIAIIFCWELQFRNALLLLFAVHFLVRVWTLIYFAPNIIEFQKVANSGENIPDLRQRARRWKIMNYIRVGLFVLISLFLVPLCLEALRYN